jgi:hypothetical protein
MSKLFIVFCFFAVMSHAQTSETYHLIDSLTGSSIPFGLVIDKTENKGIITDENGFFNLPKSELKHIYLATSIGYDTAYFGSAPIKGFTILLSQRPQMLRGVTISSCTKTESWGFSKQKPELIGEFAFQAGDELALFMPNTSKKVGQIQKVRFYIGKEGYGTTKFRAKIYDSDTISGKPANLLNEQDIILNTKRGNRWVEFDLTEMNISIPQSGFYVSMEWLPDGKDYHVGNKDGFEANGQALGYGKSTSQFKICQKNDGVWKKVMLESNLNIPMIGADVLVPCKGSDSK